MLESHEDQEQSFSMSSSRAQCDECIQDDALDSHVESFERNRKKFPRDHNQLRFQFVEVLFGSENAPA